MFISLCLIKSWLGVGNRSLGWDPHLPGADGGSW